MHFANNARVGVPGGTKGVNAVTEPEVRKEEYTEAEKESLRKHQADMLSQERLGISQEIRDELVANKCLGEGTAFDIIGEILAGKEGAVEKLRANKGNPAKVQQTA